MPAVDDYSRDDEDTGGSDAGYSPAQSAAIGSATGGPKQATPQKQQESEYVPWSSFVNANEDVSKREAGKLAGQVQGDVTRAQSELSGATSTPNAPTASSRPDSVAAAPGVGAKPAVASRTAVAAAPQSPASGEDRAATAPGYVPNPANVRQTTPNGEEQAAHISSNPWASLAGTPAAASSPGLAAPQGQVAASNPLAGYERARAMAPGAAEQAANQPKDLEAQMGQQAWSQLLGDTRKASSEANALGSETGVQGLLQSQQSAPGNSAFDAALISGQGGPQFQKLANDYGKGQLGQNVVNAEQASQDRWAQLQGDASTRQAFDKAAAGANAPAAAGAADSAPTQGGGGSFSISSTNGANGQFDASQLPPNFDPSQSQGYSSALQQLQQASPLPPYAQNPQDFLKFAGTDGTGQQIWAGWQKALGLTGDQLRNAIFQMPQWQWEMFARGIVPASLQRGQNGQAGYFEGFMPVKVSASGAGTDPKYAAFKTAMDIYQAAVLAAAGPVAGGISKAGANAVASSANNPNNTGDPFGQHG